MRKVFGIGETILDIIFRNDKPQKAVPGGSVFNGLISLGRLNVPVSFISELGNDRVGDMIRDFMEDNHITTEFVDRFPDGKSPISLAFLDDDKNANYIFYKDYPAQRLEVPLFFMLFRWVGTPVTLSNSPIFSPETEPPPHAFSLHEKNPSPEENREGVFSMFFVYSIY